MKIKNYFTPKSFVYTGKHQDIATRIRSFQYGENLYTETSEIEKVPKQKQYIQVIGLQDIEKIEYLKEQFQIDSFVFEDIFNVTQRNKIEVYNSYIFAVFHCEFLHNEVIEEEYMSLVVLGDTIITFHEKEPNFLDALHALLEHHHETKSRSIDYLFYQILDIITDHHLDVCDFLEEKNIQFEEMVLESKDVDQEAFYISRKQMLRLKNNVTPVLEQLEKVLNKCDLFQAENTYYFEDLKDHLRRLDIRLSESREVMRHLLDLHMNNQSHKMNKIMTTLTIFSAIFIPLSFLTGFFGMNFIYFKVLEEESAIPFFIIFCVVLAIGMIIFFKKKKWF